MLFHVVRNDAPSETVLLHSLEQELRSVLPSEWALQASWEVRTGDERADLLFDLRAPDHSGAQIIVEAKSNLDPRDVSAILRQFARYERIHGGGEEAQDGRIVVAPYLSPRTRELLAEADAGWYDGTGNFRVRLDRPALFVDRHGADRNPYAGAQDRRLRSLRGPGAARIVRSLLDDHLPVGVRMLASRSRAGAATSSRVLDLLAREDLIEKDREGAVIGVKKRSLVRRWVRDYGLTTTNHAVPVLAPRGIDRMLRDLAGYSHRYALTGGGALRSYLQADVTAVAPLSLLTVFVDDAVAAQRDLSLRPADRGANVLLIEPFDQVVYRDSVMGGRVRCVSPGQAVADLLTGPGRFPEEGEQLLGMLASKDEEWAR